jgi:four helix bundle protein
MRYDEWLKSVPSEISGDALWKMEAYRLALFAADIGWSDVTKLMGDRRTMDLSNQLFRAIGSVSANISEGYSRGTSRDRARFYEYALGSARESRGWYYKGRHILRDDVVKHRMQFLSQIIRLLLSMVPEQRGYVLKEEAVGYHDSSSNDDFSEAQTMKDLSELLNNVPT